MQILTNQLKRELKEHGNPSFPFLISHECLSQYETGSFLWHWHPEIELTLIEEGEMIYEINHTRFHLKKGQALFGNVNTLHSGSPCQDKDCRYTSITFHPRLIYGSADSIVFQKYVEPITRDFSLSSLFFDGSHSWHADVIASMKKLIALEPSHCKAYELQLIIELEKLWLLLFLNASRQSAASLSSHEKLTYERIKKILTYLEDNYAKKITLQDISIHTGLCTSECSRIFKKGMQVSLFSFLQEYRIERSLEYLAQPSLSIMEIAAMTGFTDSNYYSKTFVKYKGSSPQKYRKHLSLSKDTALYTSPSDRRHNNPD